MKKIFFSIAIVFICFFGLLTPEKTSASTATIYAYSSSWFRETYWWKVSPQNAYIYLGGTSVYRGEMTFTTGGIPSDATINSVTLHMFPKACGTNSPAFDLDISQLTENPDNVTSSAAMYILAHGGNRYVDNNLDLTATTVGGDCVIEQNTSISLGSLAVTDFKNQLAAGWFGLGFSQDTATLATPQMWGFSNADGYKPYLVVDYITNSAPVAIISSQPTQVVASAVLLSATVSDTNNDVTSLILEYSLDGSIWASSTLGAVSLSEGSVSKAVGNISGIDTDLDGSVDLSIVWNIAADIPNTNTTSVYFRLTPNDGTVNGDTQTSSAFSVNNMPATPVLFNSTFTHYLISGLAGWWTFDGAEINNTTSTDKSGYGNNATLTNGPRRIIGRLGQGLYFDGYEDYISALHSDSLNISSAITMSDWVRPYSVSGTSTIAAKGDLFSGYSLYLDNGKPTLFLNRVGNSWFTKDSSRSWRDVAMSYDGTKQIAVGHNERIYLSTDSGNTWTATSTAREWRGVAMSADGTIQTAVPYSGTIYTSSDGGNTWISRNGNRWWREVAMSADGTIQTALDSGGKIYTSSDSGVSWFARDSNHAWRSVAMSSDGVKQTAVVEGGQIYTSTNSGVSWTARDSSRTWLGVDMSADGVRQVAIDYNGYIYLSTNSGVSWTAVFTSHTGEWRAVAMSDDGQTIVADDGNDNPDYIYVSYDGGSTWSAKGSSRHNRVGVAISGDGLKMTSAINFSYIYTSANRSLSSTSTLVANDWYHLAGVFTGDTANLYINGILNTSTSYGTITADSNTSTLRIGGSSAGNYFNGRLDDVKIYNYGLTSQEVKKTYSRGKFRPWFY